MAYFETVNELTLKVTFNNGERIHSKAGAMIGFQGDLNFDKELLGPGRTAGNALVNQLARRLTGENLPLMLVTPRGKAIGYFANLADRKSVV